MRPRPLLTSDRDRGRSDSPSISTQPTAQLTQEKLAESDMVGWLTYPTELARAPDAIELMRAVEVDTGPDEGGVFVY